MLQATDVTVDFGTRILFENITFTIKPNDKIGLAGRNGAGKSTLLKIIAGQYLPTSGSLSQPNTYTIGYLPQELKIESTESIFNEAKSALSQLEALEGKQQKITEEITTRTDYESDAYLGLIEELNRVNDQLEYYGGHNVDQQVEEVLKGLGFTQEDLHQSISTFSGGWQMRVELAKLLLKNPDLMLLDEPTNHLDIESILWLEQFLKNHKGSIVMVSHDKQFLDAITNRTIEIINQGIEDYRAPYSTFLSLREERLIKLEQAKKNQEKEIQQTEELINKFRAKKNKAKFAQTLIRKLENMDRIEIDNFDQKTMQFSIPISRRSGKEVVIAKQVSKSYGKHKVIDNLSLNIYRGDRIAFVGKNGMGKSTLAKMIVGEIDYQGSLTLGYNIDLGYYAQHQNKTLDESITLLETIEKAAPKEMQGKERSLLGSFLFSGDEIEKKVSVLSGGEKARLALAKMVLQPINFLVLDEPTNHLDLQSKDILKEALLQFDGTLLIVSHDRNFLEGLTDKVYEFTQAGIKEYLGDINYFLQQKGSKNFREFEQDHSKENKNKLESHTKNSTYAERKEFQKAISRYERMITKIEKEILKKEAEIEDLNEQLKDPKFYSENATNQSFFKDYDKKKNDITLLYERFEETLKLLEKAKEKLQ